jgi:hypothetical protein
VTVDRLLVGTRERPLIVFGTVADFISRERYGLVIFPTHALNPSVATSTCRPGIQLRVSMIR